MSIKIRPLSRVESAADTLMVPVMYIVAGTFKEKPQRTHRWNNHKLSKTEIAYLQKCMMASAIGVKTKVQKHGGIHFHIPILGGWREYVVVSPEDPTPGWYTGWHNEKVSGVSRIRLTEPVRLLVGPEQISFFGVSLSGKQIPVKIIGKGRVGDNGQFKHLPLL